MAALACGRPRVPDGQTPGAGMSQDFTLLRLAGPAHNLIWGEQLATWIDLATSSKYESVEDHEQHVSWKRAIGAQLARRP